MDGKPYRAMRDYENLQRAYFAGAGEYSIPILSPVRDVNVDNWISFNYVRGCDDPEVHGVHFFVDDYQFVRVWKDPDRYANQLKRFQAVCAPDFSIYIDFPKAIQVYNHYRKHWVAAYWQMNGITVIPTITWGDPGTFDWCFDGEPEDSVLAMSSVGMINDPQLRGWMVDGFYEVLDRLYPRKILWKGRIPEELERGRELIEIIPSFVDKWNETE